MKNIPRNLPVIPLNKIVFPENGEAFITLKVYKKDEYLLAVPTKQPKEITTKNDTMHQDGVICKVLSFEKDGDRDIVTLVGILKVHINGGNYTPIEQVEPKADYEMLSQLLLEAYGRMATQLATPPKSLDQVALIHRKYGNKHSPYCNYGVFVDTMVWFALDKGENLDFQVSLLREPDVEKRFNMALKFFDERNETFRLRRKLAVSASAELENKKRRVAQTTPT